MICTQCSREFIPTGPRASRRRRCDQCREYHRIWWEAQAAERAKLRNNDQHRKHCRDRQSNARKANEITLLNNFGDGVNYQCQCGHSSPVKRQFSFHHIDPSKKTCKITRKLRNLDFSLELLENEQVIFECENCHRNRHIKRTLSNVYQKLQEGGVEPICAICHRLYGWHQIDFHHLDSTKKLINPSRVVNCKLAGLLAELNKCVMVCACCHRSIDAQVATVQAGTKTVSQIYYERAPVKCIQRVRRDQLEPEDRMLYPQLFDRPIGDFRLQHEKLSNELRDFISRYEWLGSIGNTPRWCFTARIDGVLAGVVMANNPNTITKMINHPDNQSMQCLIQRGASASFGNKNMGSHLIMFAIRWLVKNTEKRIFIGYSDPEAGERGRIYAACNFDYLGSGFGVREMLTNPNFNNGKPFSRQSLYRTGSLRRFMKMNNTPWLPHYAKPNGYKDLSAIPSEIIGAWKSYNSEIVSQSARVKQPSKKKWSLLAAPNRRELKRLRKLVMWEIKKRPEI